MEGLLPLRPRPLPDELLSSWMQRLAQANGVRLTYLTLRLTGDSNLWTHDPDRWPRPDLVMALSLATGVAPEVVQDLSMQGLAGRVFPSLSPRGGSRWVMPLYRRSYRRERPGQLWCPGCLQASAHVRRVWRLSFMVACPEHGTLLLDRCPSCQAPYAPLRNDLGRGQDWSRQSRLPFGQCSECGLDLTAVAAPPADGALLDTQATLLAAAQTGVMAWPGQGEGVLPSQEGFDVLHQLIAVARTPGMARELACAGLPGPVRRPGRVNASLEDHDLEGRALLLGQATFLAGAWPDRFMALCRLAGLTRRPLTVNFLEAPGWYLDVADTLSQANGRRPYTGVALAPHLSLAELQERRYSAPTAEERTRWEIVVRYAADPRVLPVARALGVHQETVRKVVRLYNTEGPERLVNPNRGRKNVKKRLLDEAQEAALHVLLASGTVSYVDLADWVERETGRRPSDSTLWMYRRGVERHSRFGRRAR